jgi:hypothetical protein
MQGFHSQEAPFVPGSLYGLRSFRITRTGTLTGVVYPLPWRDGENLGRCAAFDQFSIGWHQAGTKRCLCGFYAYFGITENSANAHAAGKILGIIEGYGKVTYGDQGFRSSKARIVAIVNPMLGTEVHRPLIPSVKMPDFWPWARIGPILAMFCLVIANLSLFVLSLFGVHNGVTHNIVTWDYVGAMPLVVYWAFKTMQSANATMHGKTVAEYFADAKFTNRQLWGLQHYYPEAMQFETIEEAVRAFPLSRYPGKLN